MVTSKNLTITFRESNYFTRRFLFTLNRLGVLRTGSLSSLFKILLLRLRLTGLFTLLPEIVDSSSDICSLTASFLRCIDNHLLFWAIIINSNIYCFFRYLSDHVYLMPSKFLILAIRLGQVCRGIVLSVAVRVLLLLFTWQGNKNIFCLFTSLDLTLTIW